MGELAPKQQLLSRGLNAKRHFGQNFLADRQIADRIAELAVPTPGGTVAEIGAGLGALTRPLLKRADRVHAIERDRDLIPELAELATHDPRLIVHEADAKTINYTRLFQDAPRPHAIAGNLPYQLTGFLLERICNLANQIDGAVVLVQLEVAERLRAQPGTKTYGALSVFVQAVFEVDRALLVRRGAFYPQPRVDSAVVTLRTLSTPRAVETRMFQSVVRGAFGQRRKKLRNALGAALDLSAPAIEAAARAAGVDLDVRGESLDVDTFGRLAVELEKANA